MRKLVCILMTLISLQPVFAAAGSANIRIDIHGAKPDNTYFLCLPNVGCLSILAAQKGKIYPIFRPIHLNSLYVTDIDNVLDVPEFIRFEINVPSFQYPSFQTQSSILPSVYTL